MGSHSAPFPRALAEFFVKAYSDPGDIVFDPFQGSGTTIAAAHVLDRVGYGCEISPAYCDVILQRIEHLVETEPVLAESGERFSEVAAARAVLAADDAVPSESDSRSSRQKRNAEPIFAKSGRIR